MIVPCPSLSSSGWVTSLAEKADLLISHIYTSDILQSSIYPNQVTNIQGIVEEFGHDPLTIVSGLRIALTSYLNRYYQSCDVEVTTDAGITNLTNKIGITVYCTVVEEGKTYSFGKLISVVDSKIASIIKLNNG